MAVPDQLKIARIILASAVVTVVFAALVYGGLFSMGEYKEEIALLLLATAATEVAMSFLILRRRT